MIAMTVQLVTNQKNTDIYIEIYQTYLKLYAVIMTLFFFEILGMRIQYIVSQ
jgi:hypothetical protein